MINEQENKFTKREDERWRKSVYENADSEQRKRFDESDTLVKETNALINKTYRMGAKHAIDIAKDCLKNIMDEWEIGEEAKSHDYVAGVSFAYIILDQLRKGYDK